MKKKARETGPLPDGSWPHLLVHTGMVKDVVKWLGGPYMATALRETCKQMASAIEKPAKLPARMLILWSVIADEPHVVRLAVDKLPQPVRADTWEWVLENAAEFGAIKCCRAARDEGAIDFDAMLAGAASYGHMDVCVLAREWGAKNVDRMLRCAMTGYHFDVARLAIDWSATAVECLLDVIKDIKSA